MQLWSYDGTNVSAMMPSGMIGGFYAFVFNDTLYFMASSSVLITNFGNTTAPMSPEVADIKPGPAGSLPIAMSQFQNSFLFSADDGLHGTELWRLDPLSSVFRVTGLTRQGTDISVNWITPGGWTNIVQTSDDLDGGGNFTDLTPPIITTNNGGVASTNFIDAGGATHPSRYYRLRIGP